MSYELGALHHPKARGRVYLAARKPSAARAFALSKNPRSPFMGLRVHQYGAVHAPYGPAPVIPRPQMMPLSMYQDDGLGFSLKPPKSVRKAFTAVKKAVTLKNVLKVGAIVGAAALIPGALPLIAKGALGAGKLVLGSGKLAAKGVGSVAKFGLRNVFKAGRVLQGPGGTPPITAPSPAEVLQEIAQPQLPSPAAPLEPAAPTVVPGYGGGGGGGGYAVGQDDLTATTETEAAPSQAGIGGGAVAALAVGALLLLSANRRQRRR